MVQTCEMGCMHGSDSVTCFSVHSQCFQNIVLYNELYAWFRPVLWAVCMVQTV